MATPTVRLGGGVWRLQDELRVELRRRLEQGDIELRAARSEVDRVHVQCVALLRETNDLRAGLQDAEAEMRRRDEELHAARANVAELMALLTQANEDRVRLETERAAAAKLWQNARDQQQQTAKAMEEAQRQKEEADGEAKRLRDMLYDLQEKHEYQHHDLERQRRQLKALAHSNKAKDRQVLALIRERDAFAQKLAQYRNRTMEGRPLPPREPAVRSPPQPSPTAVESSCENVTWTENVPAVTPEKLREAAATATEFERQKQRLRVAAQHAKARFEQEREANATLHKRLEALARSHDELLVRFRGASQAKTKRQRAVVAEEATTTISQAA